MPFALKDLYALPGRVVVTAHRGFSAQHPENTMAAFLAAVELGVDIIEFDVRGTQDGVPIVLHDPTLERTANRPGSPRDYPLAEFKRFEASYWSGPHDGGRRLTEPAVPGTRIPTFEEVLRGVGETVGLNIQVYDTAPQMLAEICRLYRAYDLYERGYLTLPGFDDAATVRKLDANIALCVTDRRGPTDVEALGRHRACGCDYVQPRRSDVTAELCAAARSLGLCANMFYANTAEDTRRYVELGIPGILTDRPDIVIRTLQEMGHR